MGQPNCSGVYPGGGVSITFQVSHSQSRTHFIVFSVDPAAVVTVGRTASGRACDMHLVLCACARVFGCCVQRARHRLLWRCALQQVQPQSIKLFFQWIPAVVFTVGRRASGRACDRYLVLCARVLRCCVKRARHRQL
jgi:hypothetical protein